MDNMICVGAIAGAFGVHGDVRLKSFTAQPEDIVAYGPLVTQDGALSFTITLIGQTNNALTAKLSNVTTKEQADALRGVKLFADRAQLPHLPDDEYYHADLIGLEVYDTGGTLLGRVKDVHNHGASDLLELQGTDLKDTVLLPFTLEVVPTVDMASGRIVADPPEGLFPE